jgi:hypothetical protein
MASDDAYAAFLTKANEDPGAGQAAATAPTATAITTTAVDAAVPAALQGLHLSYASEADEPFEPVSLQWTGPDLPADGTSASRPCTHAFPTIDIRCSHGAGRGATGPLSRGASCGPALSARYATPL